MSEYKSFQGKHVDDAITDACHHFHCSREELEVDIVTGGSSGIFGLGVKKAKIKARKRQTVDKKPSDAPSRQHPRSDTIQSAAKQSGRPPKAAPSPTKKASTESPAPAPLAVSQSPSAEDQRDTAKVAERSHDFEKQSTDNPRKGYRQDQANAHTARPFTPRQNRNSEADFRSGRPPFRFGNMEEVDVEAARACILECTKILLTNISEGTIHVDMDAIPIAVVIEDEVNSGLIIGREGQTISAMQYLLNRMVSRKHPGIARIQIDAGDYREKQEEQLRRTAVFLAQKAKATQRIQSTHPLSSYHRRVVHMALQDEREIVTRSKGDGPLKRVLIMPRRRRNDYYHNGPMGNGRGGREYRDHGYQGMNNETL